MNSKKYLFVFRINGKKLSVMARNYEIAVLIARILYGYQTHKEIVK